MISNGFFLYFFLKLTTLGTASHQLSQMRPNSNSSLSLFINNLILNENNSETRFNFNCLYSYVPVRDKWRNVTVCGFVHCLRHTAFCNTPGFARNPY